jgi:hypothetical protein
VSADSASPDDALPDSDAKPQAGSNFDFTDPNSPLAPYYMRTSHVLATLLIAALFVFFNLTPLGHSDIWGHLKIGEWIIDNQRLPERELFSPFSDPTLPASNFQWLSQAMYAGAFRFGAWFVGGTPLHQVEGGIEMLRTLHALCEALKALFLLLALRRIAGSLPLAIAGVCVVFSLSLFPSAVQRPQAFAEVLFALTLWLLSRPLVETPEPNVPLSWRRTLAIAAVLTLWANIHGSFLIGIALVGLFWLGAVISSLQERGFATTIADRPLHRTLLAVILGTVLLSLLNPHGIRAIPEVLLFGKSPNVMSMREWRPIEFSTGLGGHWSYLIALGLVILTQLAAPRVYGPTQLLLLLVFGTTPLLQERLMTWWVMLVPVLVAPMWATIVTGDPEKWTSVLSLRKTIIAAGILLVGLIWSSAAQIMLGHPPTAIVKSATPATLWQITDDLLHGKPSSDDETLKTSPLARALSEELKNYPGGVFQGNIFTPEEMGDYLVWSLPAKAPVIVYSHVHAFPPGWWEDYVEVLFGRSGWRGVLDRERVNLVICKMEHREELFEKLRNDPDWVILLDQSETPINRSQRLFAAIRKQPIG